MSTFHTSDVEIKNTLIFQYISFEKKCKGSKFSQSPQYEKYANY